MTEPARWLPADDPGNPFGVPLLDLMTLQGWLSTSSSPDAASKAVSWGGSTGSELDPGPVLALPPTACTLRYPVARSLPEGLLFAPTAMEEKWVLAWRGGRVLAARSWTGVVEAVADGRLDGDVLVLERLRVAEGSSLRLSPGRVADTFDWLVRSHALGQRLPLPVDDTAADLLERTPLAGFGPFGTRLFCAARTWAPPPPSVPLRADGDVLRAAIRGDLDGVRRAVLAGADVDAPGTHAGFTALHVAAARGDRALLEGLLGLGAAPTARADGGQHALGLAVVHGAPLELLDLLIGALDPHVANDDGFTALHAAAEVDRADVVPWLADRGLRLEARTRHGHTALHVACGLGHRAVAEALLRAGADPQASSPGGTPLDVARAEGKAALVALLGGG